RASRTAPFVAKATGNPVARIAALVMAGRKLSSFDLRPPRPAHISVKEAVFPFARFANVDTVLGPEMRSTGEVMGVDATFDRAFAKSQLGGGAVVPTEGCAFVSVRDADKADIVEVAKGLLGEGFRVLATGGTAAFLETRGLTVEKVNKVMEGRPHIVDAIKNGEVQIVFNTTEGAQSLSDSKAIRRLALMSKIPYYTTAAGAKAAVRAIQSVRSGSLEVAPIQSYSS
ncbi:MAG: carbamoyl phosphate synthase large subunit, partial [Pseudomonadota bacterium]